MIDYAAQLADLRLFTELKNSAGRDGLTETDVMQLVGMVNHAAAVAGPLLALIPQTFRQYTDHDIGHCRNLIDLMGRFIPEETLRRLNGLELAVLLLSALLHDFGMFVKDEERAAVKQAVLKSQEYGAFTAGHHARASAVEEARSAGEHERAEVIQDSLLADYFRRMHPQRARDNVHANLKDRLVFRELDISPYVLDVCESHAWGVYESGDPLHPEKTVSQLQTNCAVHAFPLNLQYIACCLRLADIMDFDRSRTPVVVFQNINFTDEKSWEEWNKHLSVGGWTINDREVSFRTECTHPSFYVAVMEFLDWVDAELGHCRRLVVKEAPAGIAERYRLHLPPVADRWDVEMKDKSYLAGGFRFQLEYERIMQLLMDKSLYPDPSLFLRELLQNALDACRNMEALAKEYDYADYTPRIAVWDYSDDPQDPRVVFQDNGVGMSRKIVENYFMRVGRSYYRSPEFDAERARLKQQGIELEATSQFGIGILSCFMVADRFEVETRRTGDRPLHITIEGPTKYFTIKLLDPPPQTTFPLKPTSDHDDGPPRHPGTRITVHLRPNTKLDVSQTLHTFAVNVDYDINGYTTAQPEPQMIQKRRWQSEEFRAGTLARGIRIEAMYDSDELSAEEEQTAQSVAESLRDVLILSRIPLEKYDFSRNLDGAAWLWLLKGAEGGGCPQRGSLTVDTNGVELIGLPEELQYAVPRGEDEAKSPECTAFINLLQSSVENNDEIRATAAVLNYFDKRRSGSGSIFVHDFIKDWNDAKNEQRAAALKYLKLNIESAAPWYMDSRVAESLLTGSPDWADRKSTLKSRLNLVPRPRSVALHGILLPAGFLEWNPMTGSSSKLEILSIPGGAQIDMPDSNAPTPAASRLFIDASEAKKVVVPLIRATVRHVLELTSNKLSEPIWRRWIDSVSSSLTTLKFWDEVIAEEFELLESQVKYAIQSSNEIIYLSRREVIDRYGRWVPESNSYADKQGKYVQTDGLYRSGATNLLLAFRNRRKVGDTAEVDMESWEMPQPDE